MIKKLAIIGTKDFASQIREYACRAGGFEFIGYLDNIEPVGNMIEGFPVLGSVDDAIKLKEDGVIDCVFIAVGYTRFDLRESFFTLLRGRVPFANIVDKSVKKGKNVIIGEGVYIGPDTELGDNTIVGNNVFVHGGTVIGHDNIICDHTYISGRFDSAGFCKIGARNFIGIRVILSDHITICDDVWVGLGCVVAKDINKPGKYMSSAAKLYKIE